MGDSLKATLLRVLQGFVLAISLLAGCGFLLSLFAQGKDPPMPRTLDVTTLGWAVICFGFALFTAHAMGLMGKLLSSLCAIVGTVSFVSTLVWMNGSRYMAFWEGSPAMRPWNLIGELTEWAAGLNIVLAIVVIAAYDKRRGWFGLSTSGFAFIFLFFIAGRAVV